MLSLLKAICISGRPAAARPAAARPSRAEAGRAGPSAARRAEGPGMASRAAGPSGRPTGRGSGGSDRCKFGTLISMAWRMAGGPGWTGPRAGAGNADLLRECCAARIHRKFTRISRFEQINFFRDFT